MTGGDRHADNADNNVRWLTLTDETTGEVVGSLSERGEVRSDDPAVVERAKQAFRRELLVEDGQVIDELGLCFANIESVRPDDPRHRALVIRNLGALTGLIPDASAD